MNKGALKVTIAVAPDQNINIWNVHLQDGVSGPIRSGQIAELIGWIKEAKGGQLADVVGGDFNFTPESEEFKRFVAAIGPDVHQLAKDAPFPTWDGLQPNPGIGQTLDHMFIRM